MDFPSKECKRALKEINKELADEKEKLEETKETIDTLVLQREFWLNELNRACKRNREAEKKEGK